MKSESASDSHPNRFERAIRDYAPKPSRKFQKLLPLKAGIAELRKRRASYKTIVEILYNLNIAVACDTVCRFCHEILGEPKAHYRRKRRTLTLAAKRPPVKNLPGLARTTGVHRQTVGHSPRLAGPRVADPNNI